LLVPIFADFYAFLVNLREPDGGTGIAAWRKRRQAEMAGEQGADPVLEEV